MVDINQSKQSHSSLLCSLKMGAPGSRTELLAQDMCGNGTCI